MGVYARYKKDPEGFRNLVSLLETTPPGRRERMIQAGMAEDPEYTREALRHLLNFEDVMGLPEEELAEVLARVQPRILAVAIFGLSSEVRERFVRCAPPKSVGEIEAYLESQASENEVRGARLLLIGAARKCEKSGMVKVKRISR